MSRTKKFFEDISHNRRKIFVVLVMVLIIPIFQNCSGGFSSNSDAAGAGPSGSGALGTGTSGAGTTSPTTPVGPTGPTQAEIQKACQGMLSTPSISAPNVSSVVVHSGMGSTDSGDEKSTVALSLTSDRGVADPTTFASMNCIPQFSLKLDCAVIDGDPTYPISITNAMDPVGNNLLQKSPAMTQLNLAKGSFVGNNCSAGFGQGSNTVNFKISPNTKTQRCSEGTFTIKLTVRASINGQGGGFTSAPKYLSVQMKNGCWVESQLKDSVGNIAAVANFGTAVAINGSWAAIVAPTDDAGSILDVGSVYMYKLEGSSWNQKQKIQIGTAQAHDTISSVAINGNRMVLGSPSPYVGGQGNAYYFTQANDVWTLSRQISPPVSQSDQAFGQVVGINAGQIFISAPGFNSAGLSKSGAVYIYNSDGSNLAQTLSGKNAYVAFGSSLSVDGSVLAVGAPQAIGREAMGNGSVYVYTYSSSWSEAAVKTGSTVAETFGASVAVLGNHLVVGSPSYATGTATEQGLVSIYNTYTDATPSTLKGATSDRFGTGVALSSTGVYIGVPGTGGRAGRVDHYLYSDLTKVYFRIAAYNSTVNSDFGNTVAASGSDVVIGSRIKSDPNDNSGAAYIYRYK